MKRSGFSTKPPPRAANAREGEFVGFKPRPRDHAVPGLVTALAEIFGMVARPVVPKTPGRKSTAIRDSARGEECLLALPECPSDPAMTIWSHNRHGRAGKGMGVKALDLNGCYACTHCDAVYDGQAPLPQGWWRDMVELAWYAGHDKSLVKLAQKGLL